MRSIGHDMRQMFSHMLPVVRSLADFSVTESAAWYAAIYLSLPTHGEGHRRKGQESRQKRSAAQRMLHRRTEAATGDLKNRPFLSWVVSVPVAASTAVLSCHEVFRGKKTIF